MVLASCSAAGSEPSESATAAASQETTRRPLDSDWPPALASHVMVYHAGLEKVLVFGGSNAEREAFNTLWAWDGALWEILADGGPSPRLHAGLAYDSGRDRLVLYGGTDYQRVTYADLWEWDGTTWEEVSVSGSLPGSRDHHALAFDAARGVTLLFGGQDADDTFVSGTWTWNGRVWTQAASEGPPPRSTHRLAYDHHRERVVLVAGWGEDQLFGDLWEWDGVNWTKREIEGPAARGASRIAYARQQRQLLLFGGTADRTVYGETWLLENSQWRLFDGPGPPARNVHGMAYDAARSSIVLFGGIGADGRFNDLWEWDGRGWTEFRHSE